MTLSQLCKLHSLVSNGSCPWTRNWEGTGRGLFDRRDWEKPRKRLSQDRR